MNVPAAQGFMTLSPAVQRLLRPALPPTAAMLLALNAKAQRTGSPVFTGVGLAEKTRRRAAGRVAKLSRKANRP